ncbi:MAG TPA: hypothetical protein VF280_04600 [Burkholderiales bacterium]
MSRRGLKAALAGALICATAPCAAFDSISQLSQSQGVTFYITVPLDAPRARDRTFGAGLLVQGKRQEQTYNFDSRLFNNFLGSGIEAKWIIAGVVAAGAAVAVGSKSKTQSNNEQLTQQQAQQQVQNNAGTTNTAGSYHPDGTPHVPGDNCACHQ